MASASAVPQSTAPAPSNMDFLTSSTRARVRWSAKPGGGGAVRVSATTLSASAEMLVFCGVATRSELTRFVHSGLRWSIADRDVGVVLAGSTWPSNRSSMILLARSIIVFTSAAVTTPLATRRSE
eukprot:Amastigsp_a340901_14.p4 type:complete len:125 gc:universal Amastigsp_a340901_14:1668-1294(-)